MAALHFYLSQLHNIYTLNIIKFSTEFLIYSMKYDKYIF